MAKTTERVELEVLGRPVSISSPHKVLFPAIGVTKIEVVQYFIGVAAGVLRGAGGRPNVLVRYLGGVDGEVVWQKRAPTSRPEWIEVATLQYPSGRSADEVVPRSAACLAWMANLGCLELHPHPLRAEDLVHPDELRIDLDPGPDAPYSMVREVAKVVQMTLADFGLVGFPKTSGSRGIHVLVRIEPRWTQSQVRDAAMAFAHEVARRAPSIATAKWWKEERLGVFVDFNQNAKDKTVASAYSIRPTPDGRVSMPLYWEEIEQCVPEDFTIRSAPERYLTKGDAHLELDLKSYSLEALLELSAQQRRASKGDPKQKDTANAGDSIASTAEAPAKTGKRRSTKPLIEIARAEHQEDALLGLERWKARHPAAAAHLLPADVLVDKMRGRYRTWTRLRVNLEHVPTELRPPQEALEHDYDPGDIRPVNAGGASRRKAGK